MAPDPEFVVDWPALFVAADWVEAHCIIPDGFRMGDPFELYDWQLWCTLNHYRVKPNAKPAGTRKPDGTFVAPAAAFHFRRSQVIAPQKTGKGPWAASGVALEAAGPAVFVGIAKGGEAYDCADWGCPCGWGYEYQIGEPMGRPWPKSLVQLLATSEDQVANVYRPLQSMVRNGPLGRLMRVGEDFIRTPNDGRIDVVTASAQSRLGNPTTFVLQDEPQLYTKTNKLIAVAETMRRGVAGMGGRSMETGNAPDPTVDSTGWRTMNSKAADVFRFHRPPPDDLDYLKKSDRRKIHAHVYAGSPHVDLDVIEGEAAELVEKDPAQAERFFGNRCKAGSGSAFDATRWGELVHEPHEDGNPWRPPAGELIVVGVDGARFHDALAIVATDVTSGHQWPVFIAERPVDAPDTYEHDFDAADAAMMATFDTWQVWRTYCDPQFIETLFERWAGRWGDKRVIAWLTYRQRAMCYALANYRAAMTARDLSHDGDPIFASHIGAATKHPTNVLDAQRQPMWVLQKPDDGRKIDAAMAGCISWEARGDAIAAGAKKVDQFVPYRIH